MKNFNGGGLVFSFMVILLCWSFLLAWEGFLVLNFHIGIHISEHHWQVLAEGILIAVMIEWLKVAWKKIKGSGR